MNTPKANTVAIDNLLHSIARGYNGLYNELANHVDDVGGAVVEVALREVRRSLSNVVRRRIEVWMEEHEYTTPFEFETLDLSSHASKKAALNSRTEI